MKKLFFWILLSASTLNLKGQCNFKETETMAFNLVLGLETFQSPGELDSNLINNNFTKLNNSPLTFGFEFSIASRKSTLKTQLRGTNIFVSRNGQEMTNQGSSISLQYGYDLLSYSFKTYAYPFIGIRYYNWKIFGKSQDEKKLSASKNEFDALIGIGLRQFLNDDLRGVFNNIDINLGVSLPLTNGKWNSADEIHNSIIEGTMVNKTSYFILLTIGRGFRPAKLQ